MEPLGTFIVSAAASVVARLLGDSITNRKRRVDRETVVREIRHEVTSFATSINVKTVSVNVLVETTEAEVRSLASQLPGVTVSDDSIEIHSGGALTTSRRRREDELALRLKLLDGLVEKRRIQIDLESINFGEQISIPKPTPTPTEKADAGVQRKDSTEAAGLMSFPRPAQSLPSPNLAQWEEDDRKRLDDLRSRLATVDMEIGVLDHRLREDESK